MLREKLKEIALSIIERPNDFHLVIEEYFEEDGVMFVWANEEQDESITIHINSSGNLKSLSIDQKDKEFIEVHLSIEERKKQAEQFLLTYYPNALEHFTFTRKREEIDCTRFYYEQIVFDLPLEDAGCFIEVDRTGNIIEFTYDGVAEIPEIPRKLILNEQLKEDVQNKLVFQLTIANLFKDIHHVEKNGYYLVYEPKSFYISYKADVLNPTLKIEYEDEQEVYIPVKTSSKPTISKDMSIEEIVGIPPSMEVIREIDGGDEIGKVWRDKNWEMKEKNLSSANFLRGDIEKTVNVFISKETGRIRSFSWFKERSGNLQLNREACYEKAINFLQQIFPKYDQYLQQIVQENEEDDDSKVWFLFPMHNGHGISLQSEMVMVVINCTTGLVDHYSGPNVDVEKLQEISAKPAISKQEAKELWMEHLDFDLVWKKDYDSEQGSHFLVYEACERFTKRAILYIDAVTGELVTDQRV